MTLLPNRLLGPPEIHLAAAAADYYDEKSADLGTGDPFLDLMDAGFNSNAKRRPPMGLTENLSPTFLSSGNPCLDFFFQVVPSTASGTLTSILSAAWAHHPLTALKLICHLRGVRGTGKSDREGFYSAALWLHKNHPKTLALNIGPIADFGYMKDLPEILHRLIDGPDTRKISKEARKRKARRIGRWSRRRSVPKRIHKVQKEGTREERIAADLAKVKIQVEKASDLRRKKRSDMAIRAVNRYARDSDYRFLHDKIADFFADLLSVDLSHLRSGDFRKISLAAKWCPSLDSSYDKSTLLCESIARRIFPSDSDPEYDSISELHYAYRIRDRLRREALVPLRRALELPEVYMAAGRWDSLPYSRVASVAMKTYKKFF